MRIKIVSQFSEQFAHVLEFVSDRSRAEFRQANATGTKHKMKGYNGSGFESTDLSTDSWSCLC